MYHFTIRCHIKVHIHVFMQNNEIKLGPLVKLLNCHFLVPFILLFYFVSQKHINKLSFTVKQISVCYIHAVTVAVLYCFFHWKLY